MNVGDAVKIVRYQAEGGHFHALYKGASASYSIGPHRFYPGIAHAISDLKMIRYLSTNPEFVLTPAGKGHAVTVGRVLLLPELPRGFEVEAALRSWSVAVIADGEKDVLVVSPTGTEVAAAKVIPATEEEVLELQRGEAAEIEEGRRPYGGKLAPRGRGRWGLPPPPRPPRPPEKEDDDVD